MQRPKFGTFSIVAFDEQTQDLGIAVQSKFIAVGAIVPWGKARVGAVATQALANVSYGPRGLEMMSRGLTAEETLNTLLDGDEKRESRQIGVVDGRGNAAAFTGKECYEWAGHIVGRGYTCQGNILAGDGVVKGMADTYERTDGDLIDKLLAALEAGQLAGGDRRGQQSAALLVLREKGGYEGHTDRYVDLRVDEHSSPIAELSRVFKIYDATMLTREDPKNRFRIEARLAVEIQGLLKKLGNYQGELNGKWDDATRRAYMEFVHVNNFENKIQEDSYIWVSVLAYMRELAK